MKIIQSGDWHIHNKIEKHDDLKEVLNKCLIKFKELNADILVVNGDYYDAFIKPNNESNILGGWFLSECSKIFKKIICQQGNHDYNQKSLGRACSLKTVVNILNLDNIIYLDESGFYEEGNIVFASWKHSERISPWVKYPDYVKQENKVYIDLFHDPIYGSKNSFDREFKESHYTTLNDLHGDISFLNDIHQRQWFNKNGKLFAAYSSSVHQLSFGESIDKHGVLLWTINGKEDITVQEVDIETDFVYLNFYINPDEFDYEDLSKDLILRTKPKTYLKIHWKDYSSNINALNERRIKQYIKEKYPEVVFVTFDKTRINSNSIQENDYIKQSIKNIDQQSTQQEIFRQFLSEKQYDEAFINLILELDQKITNRLALSDENNSYDWEILSFYLDNYRSHGDRTDINWSEFQGVIQVTGQNAVGKTNFLSAIMYLFFNRTLETLKKEANGDNRFINNKRNLDYCEVGAIVRINGVNYQITRRTERKWDRTKTKITGTPTTITYNILDENFEPLVNLTDEEKTKTNKIIEASLGTFEDFLRTSLVNADTLNNLLSLDESTFMDNILRDSGLDIFEKKLAEYKVYLKEVYKTEEKVVIDIPTAENTIENSEAEIVKLNSDIELIKGQIADCESRILKGTGVKEDEIKKLHKVDEALAKLNLDNLFAEINNLNEERRQKEQDIQNLKNEIEKMKSTFDQETYDALIKEKDTIKDSIFVFRQDIQKNKTDKDNTIQKKSIINGEVFNINKNIKNIEGSIDSEKNMIQQNITLAENKIQMVIKNIDNQITNIKKEIEILNKSKVCPTCENELKAPQILAIQQKITKKEEEINLLEISKTTNNAEIDTLNETIGKLKTDLVEGNTKIKTLLSTIELEQVAIVEKNKAIAELDILIPTFDTNIEDINQSITNKQLELTELGEKISEIELEKQEVEKRKELIQQSNNIPLIIENIDLKIEKNKKIYESYEENQQKLQQNTKIQVTIDKYTERLVVLQQEKDSYNKSINTIQIDISNIITNIENIKVKIEKFKKQERDELIKKVYTECIHRDGLPKIILLRMRDDINQEIKDLLTDVEFTVYFDENMTLKMYHNSKPDSIANVIGGSGMERTFISVILRLALRSINNKSVGNVLFLDEICGKLVDESVTKFFDLIYKIKKNIQKIVMIEHAYADELQPDYVISITADENGVSKIEMK